MGRLVWLVNELKGGSERWSLAIRVGCVSNAGRCNVRSIFKLRRNSFAHGHTPPNGGWVGVER